MTDRPRRVVTKLLRRRTGGKQRDRVRGEPADHARGDAPDHAREPARHTAGKPPGRPGLGEAPAPRAAGEEAGDAELDTLRGELVRELDRMAADAGGSASFRRI